MSTKQSQAQSSGPRLWPLLIAIAGAALLLDNLFLLGDFAVATLWPLILVFAGALLLIQGDIIPSSDSKGFSISRGTVEAATLEISAGAIDVHLDALQRDDRLIVGQYAANSRPQLHGTNKNAHLRMLRSNTPWLSFTDWRARLAIGLPWQIFVSTNLGQVSLDLSQLIVDNVTVATGVGDIEFVTPYEALGTIHIHSTLGNIRLITPRGCKVYIAAKSSSLFRVHIDEERYTIHEDGTIASLAPANEAPLVEITLSGTFGDAYLA